MDSEIAERIRRLHGPDRENAYSDLIELDHSQVPELMKSYRAESNSRIRVLLIQIIAEYRLSTTLDFLAETIQDSNSEIWKTSLDGIVKINDRSGLEILAEEKKRLNAETSNDKTRIEWVDEAIRQLRESLDGL